MAPPALSGVARLNQRPSSDSRSFVTFVASRFIATAINRLPAQAALFPTLIWLGVPPSPPMPSTLWRSGPDLGSAWGYWPTRGVIRASALIVPSAIGMPRGAPRRPPFPMLVPVLSVRHLGSWCRNRFSAIQSAAATLGGRTGLVTMFFSCWWAHGGYWRRIGILMLAALSLMGHTDIHQMNGLRTCWPASTPSRRLLHGPFVCGPTPGHGHGVIVGGVGGANA
jgi:hypothetical protein